MNAVGYVSMTLVSISFSVRVLRKLSKLQLAVLLTVNDAIGAFLSLPL